MQTHSPFKSAAKRAEALACYDQFLTAWPIPYTTQFVSTRFGATYVIVSGNKDKPPLVLLHGAGTNSIMWMFNIADFTQHFCVYAVDIIGEPGHSAETRPDYRSDQYAQWLNEVLDGLAISQTALCGVSMGGMFAMQFAVAYPTRVTALAILASPSLLRISSAFVLRGLAGSFFPSDFFARNFLFYISASANQLTEEAVQAFVMQLKTYQPKMEILPVASDDELRKLPAKTLVMLGEKEVLYNPLAVAARLRAVAPTIQIDFIPGAKHTIHLDATKLVDEKLIQFLSAV